jgi:hypothetical protein
MQVKLALAAETLSAEALQDITRDFRRTLGRETDVVASEPAAAPVAGAKGDPVTLGVLVLTFMTSGAAVAMFEVAKAFFQRNAGLVMEFEREDGRKLKIKAENLRPNQIDRTMTVTQEFFAGSP